jgi:hypothetical protein
METNEQGPSMNQRIFELGLPTETISLYLLCCGIKDAGLTISTKNILERWNGSKQDFSTCARDLENRNIVERILSDGDGHEVFRLKDVHGWR